MRMPRVQIAVISGLGVALAAAGGVIVRQSGQLAQVRRQRDAALQSVRESQQALRPGGLRMGASMQGKPAPGKDIQDAIAKRETRIKQLTDQLDAANASITELQDTLSTSKTESVKALDATNQRSQEAQNELQARMDQLQQQLDSAKTEAESSRHQIADLQRDNEQLSASNNEGSARVAEREHILLSLQELDQRRESYLTSIADRYRNLTNQFRTMSGMLTSNRGQDSNSFGGPALDMIQNAISLTDNDLQHLSELNAKAYRLEKQLSKQ